MADTRAWIGWGSRMVAARRAVICLASLPLFMNLVGCRVGNYANENDTLRSKVVDLESQIDQLKRRNAELEAQAKTQTAGPTSLPEDVRLNMPHAAELSIDKLSFARDSN